MSVDMSVLLATMNGERADNNDAKIDRDKAYTYLYHAVDEIRETGKYLFWQNTKRYRGYTSEYNRKKEEPILESL